MRADLSLLFIKMPGDMQLSLKRGSDTDAFL